MRARRRTLWAWALAVAAGGACASEAQKHKAEARETDYARLEAAHPALDLARGRRVFNRQCITCHQADGGGTPHAIPPLASHVPSLLRARGGQSYLANVVVHGLAGDLEVLGTSYKNRMPAHGPLLHNDDIVAVLAYVSLMWGNEALLQGAAMVSPDDVQHARSKARRGADVRSLRPVLAPVP